MWNQQKMIKLVKKHKTNILEEKNVDLENL